MAWIDKYFAGYSTISLNGVPVPQRSVLNFVGSNFTVTDDAILQSTDVTASGGGGGGSLPIPRTKVTSAGMTAATLTALIAANGGAGAWLDVDCSGGTVAIAFPTMTTSAPITIYFYNGNPATHTVTITAPAGGTIGPINQPPTTAYPSGTTLQTSPANTYVFGDPGMQDTTVTYRAVLPAGTVFTVS